MMKVNVSITFLLFSTHRYNLNSITLSDLQGDNVLAKVLLKALSRTEKGKHVHSLALITRHLCTRFPVAVCIWDICICVCVCYRNYFYDSSVSNDNMKSTVVIKQQKIITGIFSSPRFYSVL